MHHSALLASLLRVCNRLNRLGHNSEQVQRKIRNALDELTLLQPHTIVTADAEG